MDAGPPPSDSKPRNFVLASVPRRLAGAAIDGAVWMAISLATVFAVRPVPPGYASLVWVVAAFTPFVLHAALIAHRGQSVGKLVTRTRIVLWNGRTAGLLRGALVRTLPFVVVLCAPGFLLAAGMNEGSVDRLNGVAFLVVLFDAALILAPGSRCLHDRLAGTHVAMVTPRQAPMRRKKRAPY
jgi:uncharacterized RDD family membrane protein YckC